VSSRRSSEALRNTSHASPTQRSEGKCTTCHRAIARAFASISRVADFFETTGFACSVCLQDSRVVSSVRSAREGGQVGARYQRKHTQRACPPQRRLPPWCLCLLAGRNRQGIFFDSFGFAPPLWSSLPPPDRRPVSTPPAPFLLLSPFSGRPSSLGPLAPCPCPLPLLWLELWPCCRGISSRPCPYARRQPAAGAGRPQAHTTRTPLSCLLLRLTLSWPVFPRAFGPVLPACPSAFGQLRRAGKRHRDTDTRDRPRAQRTGEERVWARGEEKGGALYVLSGELTVVPSVCSALPNYSKPA
jgi:hypothetical protein